MLINSVDNIGIYTENTFNIRHNTLLKNTSLVFNITIKFSTLIPTYIREQVSKKFLNDFGEKVTENILNDLSLECCIKNIQIKDSEKNEEINSINTTRVNFLVSGTVKFEVFNHQGYNNLFGNVISYYGEEYKVRLERFINKNKLEGKYLLNLTEMK